jgi:hypothetical protein
MPYPSVIVEFAAATNPYNATPTWTPITDYVREVTTRRGRSDEFQDFGSGTATIVLDNRDRRFDPLNASGPYVGLLTPRNQIRVRAVTTSSPLITQDVFRGYVSGWPVTLTDAGFDSTVTLECFDAIGLLETEEIPDDLADAYIRSLSPYHYYPLTDPADPNNGASYSAADYGSNPIPLIPQGSGIKIGNGDGLAIGLPNTCVSLAANNNDAIWAIEPTQGATAFTITQWNTYYPQFTTSVITTGYGSSFGASYDADTQIFQFATTNTSGTYRVYNSTLVLDTNIPHHFAAVINSDGTIATIYIDGIAITVTLSSTSTATPIITDRVIIQVGQHQQVGVWKSQLTATQIQTIYRLSRNIFTETTAERFAKLIAYSPFPASLAPTPSGTVATVGAFTTGGPTLASELEVVSDSEGGNRFVTKAGVVTMTSRNAFATGTSLTSQATIGTTGITIGPSIEYRLDSENMRNQLAIGFSGDGSIEVTDSTSVNAYGVAGGSITTQLTTQADAQALGDMLVGFSKDPAVVISPVEVNVSAVAADWDTILTLELLDRITFTLQPRTGAAITTPQLIQSIEHRVIPGQWSTILNGSVRFTNPFILDSSLLDGPDLLL